MGKIKIKANLDLNKLEELGYEYSIMEGGYISKDGATIVSIDRSPYQRQIMQYKPDAEVEHENNIKKLREIDALENKEER